MQGISENLWHRGTFNISTADRGNDIQWSRETKALEIRPEKCAYEGGRKEMIGCPAAMLATVDRGKKERRYELELERAP